MIRNLLSLVCLFIISASVALSNSVAEDLSYLPSFDPIMSSALSCPKLDLKLTKKFNQLCVKENKNNSKIESTIIKTNASITKTRVYSNNSINKLSSSCHNSENKILQKIAANTLLKSNFLDSIINCVGDLFGFSEGNCTDNNEVQIQKYLDTNTKLLLSIEVLKDKCQAKEDSIRSKTASKIQDYEFKLESKVSDILSKNEELLGERNAINQERVATCGLDELSCS